MASRGAEWRIAVLNGRKPSGPFSDAAVRTKETGYRGMAFQMTGRGAMERRANSFALCLTLNTATQTLISREMTAVACLQQDSP